MFRALVLSFAFSLAAAPSASFLCRAYCDGKVAAEKGCHHSQSGSVASHDNCDDGLQPTSVFVREIRTAPSEAPMFVPTSLYHVPVVTGDREQGWKERSSIALQSTRLITSLRI
jgi:hypothetical protein